MKFGKNSGINRGRTRSVMNVLISELLHQVPGAHGSTCAFLVLRKTIIHDKSHFVLPSSSTMDDRNELISRDNGRILQLFQQITFRRKYTAIQGQRKRRHGKAKRERYALSCLRLIWSCKKGKRPREVARALGQWTYYKDVQLTVTKLGVYSVAVFHSTLSFAPFRVLSETLKVASSAMVI